MMYRFLPALLILIVSVSTASAEEWDYLANDDLAFAVGDMEVYTTGNSVDSEWFGVRLVNDTGALFKATEVHFITAEASSTQNGSGFCAISGDPAPGDRLPFRLKIWEEVEAEGGGISLEPGEELLSYETDSEGSEAAVNYITRVDLGGELELEPGEAVRVGISFRGDRDICSGQLVQDASRSIGEMRNFLRGSILGCVDTYSQLVCDSLIEAGFTDIFGDCEDSEYRWRPWNYGCENPTDVPGVGASGDLAIRLARPAGGTGPSDTGGHDSGTPDTGASDMGRDAAADVVVAPELDITRISPSMGPSNLDIDLQIFGTGFADGIMVRIGPANLENLVVVDSTEMTATLLADSLQTGMYDVIANLGADEDTYPSGYQVTDAEYEAPSITRIEPNSAQEGAEVDVTITGANFRDDADVLFGGRSGTNVVIRGEGESMTVTAPTTLQAGIYDVEVENADGQSDIIHGGWQVTAITAVAPEEGCCAVAGGQKMPGQAALSILALVCVAWVGRRKIA